MIITHAVIIDKDMRIVHDPNPNQKAMSLSLFDIIDIVTVKEVVYFDKDGALII